MNIAVLTATEFSGTVPPQAGVFIDLLEENGGAMPLDVLYDLATERLKTVQTPQSIFNHYNKRLFAANGYIRVEKVEGPDDRRKAERRERTVTDTGLVLAPKKSKSAKDAAKTEAFFAKAAEKVLVKQAGSVAATIAKMARSKIEQGAVL